jgi:hypothetical protein
LNSCIENEKEFSIQNASILTTNLLYFGQLAIRVGHFGHGWIDMVGKHERNVELWIDRVTV